MLRLMTGTLKFSDRKFHDESIDLNLYLVNQTKQTKNLMLELRISSKP